MVPSASLIRRTIGTTLGLPSIQEILVSSSHTVGGGPGAAGMDTTTLIEVLVLDGWIVAEMPWIVRRDLRAAVQVAGQA